MSKYNTTPTGKEVFFDNDELIVSKTDIKGLITYANDVFMRVAGYTEKELLGAPHSIVRHPDMPRCVFKLLWDTLGQGNEIFAYVKNMCKNGDHYWVFAHATPTYNMSGNIIGYHSSRRVPDREPLAIIEPLYKELLSVENRHSNAKDGMQASFNTLLKVCEDKNVSYEELVFKLNPCGKGENI